MPSKKQKEAVLSRLRALLHVVEEECKSNEAFFKHIEEILLSPEAVVSIQKKSSPTARSPKVNAVQVLHDHGEDVLRRELDLSTNDELAKIAAADGIKKPKVLPRKELIESICSFAKTRLKQGEAFTKE